MAVSNEALVRRGKLPMKASSRYQLVNEKWQAWKAFARHIKNFNTSEDPDTQKQAYVAASLAWDEYMRLTARLQKDDRVRVRYADAEVS